MRDRVGEIINDFKLISINEEKTKKAKHQVYWYAQCLKCNKISSKVYSEFKRSGCKNCKKLTPCGEISRGYFNEFKRKATNRGKKFDLTIEYLWKLFLEQNKRCAFSGERLVFAKLYGKEEQTASLDRIDSSIDYVKDNVQWVHKDINNMKMSLPEERFYDLCKKINSHNNKRYLKQKQAKIIGDLVYA